MADYNLEIEEHEGFTIISFAGQSDSDVIDTMDTAITKKCDESGQNIVIDLLEVEYLFSRTISHFVKYYKIMNAKNLQVVLINPSSTVRGILESTKLTRIIPVFNTTNDFLEWSRQSISDTKKSAVISVNTQNNVKVLSFTVNQEDLGFHHIGQALNEISSEVSSNKVILDLSNITTLNSVSVASLIELGKTVKKNMEILVLAGVNELTKELLNILNICSLFKLVDNVEDGLIFLNQEK